MIKHGMDGLEMELATADFRQTRRTDHCRPSEGETDDDDLIVFVGGPPYSSGHGSDSMDRKLPMHFVQHAINEWEAQIVVFLMPQRCQKFDYASILSTVNYQMETMALPNFIFLFPR
jgi:hypothetical protein